MTEIRTTSSTGGQKGVKDERHDLIPRKGVAAIARVFAFGAKKYADHNWRRGYEWSKSIAALDRHFSDFVDGQTYDTCRNDCEFHDENGDLTCRNHSGLHHLAHAGFHILVLLTWHEEQGEGVNNEFDDRWPHSMVRARLAALEEEDAFQELGFTDADGLPAVDWKEPVTRTFEATGVPLEIIALATGISEASLRKDQWVPSRPPALDECPHDHLHSLDCPHVTIEQLREQADQRVRDQIQSHHNKDHAVPTDAAQRALDGLDSDIRREDLRM